MTETVRDITDADFDTAVVARSREIPVVIDLWAPWCGPCRQLGPVLEKVADARRGEFELVKLNVDENPETAGKLGARSIPLVVAFKDGQAVSQFVGAQPEGAILRFIDSIVPGPADKLVAAARSEQDAGKPEQAENLLRQALEHDRQHTGARLDLAELLANAERYEEALEVLNALPSKGNDPVGRLISQIRTQMAGPIDLPALEQKAQQDPGNLDAAIELGKALGATGEHARALDILLDAIRKDPSYNDGAARQAVIDLLAVMGPGDPMTREYRQKLATALH